MYKKATRKKIRFTTSRGMLATEDLWDLTLSELDEIANSLRKQVKEDEDESFIKPPVKGDGVLDAKFEIIQDVIKTRLLDAERATKAQETRVRNQKVREAIAKKKDGALDEMSLEELEALDSGEEVDEDDE